MVGALPEASHVVHNDREERRKHEQEGREDRDAGADPRGDAVHTVLALVVEDADLSHERVDGEHEELVALERGDEVEERVPGSDPREGVIELEEDGAAEHGDDDRLDEEAGEGERVPDLVERAAVDEDESLLQGGSARA